MCATTEPLHGEGKKVRNGSFAEQLPSLQVTLAMNSNEEACYKLHSYGMKQKLEI